MFKLPDNGIILGPYGGISYFERRPRKAVVTPFRWRRLLKCLAALF